MDNVTKLCRFCLHSNEQNLLIERNLWERIENLRLNIKEHPKIPPIICLSCIDFINKIYIFKETAQSSENILQKLFGKKVFTDGKQDPINGIVSEQKTPEIKNEHINSSPAFKKIIYPMIPQNEEKSSMEAIDIHEANSSDDIDEIVIQRNKDIALRTLKLSIEKFSYECDICSRVFGSFFDYQDHQDSHNGEFVFCCSKCTKVFSSRNDLVDHENNHTAECPVCRRQMLPKSLDAHMKKHTDFFKCNICNSRHSSKAAMEKHIKAKHEGLKGYICHICGKQNSCQTSMTRHLASHLPNKPYACNFCNFTTKLKTLLKMHIYRKHSSEKCKCNVCENWFKSEFSLKRHQNRMHNPKNHRCKHCGKYFREKFNLNQHVENKHAKQRVYGCKMCHQEFYTTQLLKNHMHIHRSSCVSCSKCAKVFAYKKYLEKHVPKCTGNTDENKTDSDILLLKHEK